MSVSSGMLSKMIERRDQIKALTESMLQRAQNEGREHLNEGEAFRHQHALAEIAELNDRIREMHDIRESRIIPRELRGGLNHHSNNPERPIMNDSSVYRSPTGPSWIRDLCRVQLNRDEDGSSRRRLSEYGEEVERRDISRVDGQGGYAVPPAWLMNQYVELARPGRVFADLCQRQPLPGGTDSINIPKLLTGTSTAVQTADNTQVQEIDLTDTFINAPVRTIAGQQGVALQLIDQSPIAFDQIVFADLIADHAVQLDKQVLYGSGTSGQVLGVNLTPGIQTVPVAGVTIQNIYSAIAQAINLIHTTRFQPPTAVVMAPRRWAWLLAQLDQNNRPLFIPDANVPFNAAGLSTDVAAEGLVGTVQGLPVYVDPNLSTTVGPGTSVGSGDVIYVLRTSDLVLWESGVRARVLPEPRADTLTVLLQIYSYVAFSAARYAQSIVELTGLPAPTFP